ncbi:hypothetical protein BH11MYX1_BH11MYX1_02170 [soil metagenome]
MAMRMRVLAIGLAAGLAGLAVRSDSLAQPAPDFARAKQLYDTASSELDKGASSDAVRDFGAAYEITKDPVLFFKIAAANEKAGHCDVALVYYARYLREAKPAQHYVDVTQERVAACGGDWRSISAAPIPAPVPLPDSGSGSAGAGAGGPPPEATSSSGSDLAATSTTNLGSGGASSRAHQTNDLPWLMLGGALAFVTAGAVFAYSASSSENDIKDLYIGVTSTTPVFDATIAKRYQELLDEGHRYQYLSGASGGVATWFTVAAALLFVHDHNEHEKRLFLTPTASPTGAGVSATFRF